MSEPLAALLGLEQQLRKSGSLAQLAFTIAGQTQACVPYAQSVLLLGKTPDRLRVIAASDVASIDQTSPYVNWIERLASSVAGGENGPDAAMVEVSASDPALQGEWHEMAPPWLLCQPLKVEALDGELVGVLLLFRGEPWSDTERGICSHLASTMAHALFAFRRSEPMTGLLRRLRGGRTGLIASIGLVAVLSWPVRLSALAPVEVIAQDPVVVSAPMDGAVREIKVLPNQVVAKGDVLAVMEDAELSSALEVARRELLVAIAELRTVQQGGFLDPTQKARLAELEARVKMRQAQLDFAQGRYERATVQSPGDGVVVLGDPNDWKGRPVRVGERILLVARPAKVELQAMLAVKDSIALAEGARMNVFFDKDPLGARGAILRHAAYEPHRTPEDILAYRLVASLDKDGAQEAPRIGMRGTARVYGEQVSLFFYLFRRPITSLRQWVGW